MYNGLLDLLNDLNVIGRPSEMKRQREVGFAKVLEVTRCAIFAIRVLNEWYLANVPKFTSGLLFSKVVPNLKKLGLLDAGDGWLRTKFEEIEVIQYDDWNDAESEYEAFDFTAAQP